MKKLLYLSLALVLLVACSQDSFETSKSKAMEGNLSFEIKDKGFVSVDTPITRATTDNKFITRFQNYDEAGLYIVRDGKVIAANVKLQASKVGNTDSIAWRSETPVSYNSKDSYYIYTPYLPSPPEAPGIGDVFTSNSEGKKDSLFFANMINAWEIDKDINGDYDDNDLMTGTGIVNGKTNRQAYAISCSMTHRMAAVLLEFPSTIYRFSDSSIPDYKNDSVRISRTQWRSDEYPTAKKLLSISGLLYLKIVKPLNATKIEYNYCDQTQTTPEKPDYNHFTITTSPIASGTYKTYKIDNGVLNIRHYVLQKGDYFCTTKDKSDWYIKPHELILNLRDSCIGIVNYIGDTPITDNYGLLKNEQFRGGKIHGIIAPIVVNKASIYYDEDNLVATTDAGKSVWSSFPGQTNISEAWLKSSTWTGGIKRPDNFISLEPTDKFQGYANTVALEEYNKQYQPVKGSKYVNVLDALEKFRTLFHYKVPSNTSGWYLPSIAELQGIEKLLKFETDEYSEHSIWSSSEYKYESYGYIINTIYGTTSEATSRSSNYDIYPMLVF